MDDEPRAFVKEKALDASQLIERVKLSGDVDADDDAVVLGQGDGHGLTRKEREAVAEKELHRKTALGQTQEAAQDLERLEEIRMDRERAKQRSQHEAKRKELLREKAAERAAALAEKAKNGGGKKKGGKNKKKR